MNELEEPSSQLGLKTRHVLIDTSVYRRFGFNLSSKLFTEFRSVSLSHQLELHIDPIISREIDRGLTEIAAKLAAQHKQYVRLHNQWNSRFPRVEALKPMDAVGMATAAREQFDRVLQVMGHTRHLLGDQTVAEALNHYFARKAPFEREGSREFPDFFILRAAEQQAANSGGMYVVSQDKAMLQATTEFKNLHPIAGLEAFLAIITSLKDSAIEDDVRRFAADEGAVLRVGEAFADALAIEDLQYDGDRFDDFDIERFDLESIEDLSEFAVISVRDEVVTMSGEIYGEGHVDGSAVVLHDQGPDEPPYETRENFDFRGRTMARVILSFNRRTLDDIELEITQPYVHVRERSRGY